METPSVPCIAAFGVESACLKINQSSHTRHSVPNLHEQRTNKHIMYSPRYFTGTHESRASRRIYLVAAVRKVTVDGSTG